ncbi:M16 family metallopeptidase [Stakelama tenebrarum]|uniref:Insulinase family protein n=1 Tax=Stakelama tenebrarum TaxID=2711215 RepID=A0A6G6Y4U8_9SPHN|nr:pitrilysin family protein [Sphingosinithalassobacter tenebrarum]QIG79596.1 insulinase family protein [Sphingosinithalassobacter tenebrarum]
MTTLLLATTAALLTPTLVQAQETPAVAAEDQAIPYETFTLSNGLRVVVHEDHSVPKVAVAVWYHVGSMNEPEGKTGFAHLFEHLMFNGSEHRDDEYMPPLQEVGVSAVNGATSLDQTYYYEVVPTGGLERVLWLESDRMGYLLGAVSQAKLDEQRGVVQNEKRTYENRPYSMIPELRAHGLYPVNHPYYHATIGSMADLDAASLEDVKDWFRRYYGATNAVVTLAGDVTVEQARDLMERYFGSVPPGQPVSRMEAWVPTLERVKRESVQDNVPQAVLSWNWAVQGSNADETQALRMAATILGRGRLSRLYQALVTDNPYATGVMVNYQGAAIAGMFTIDVRLKPGVDPAEAEAVLQRELDRFIAEGPTEAELARYKTIAYSDNVRSRESLFVRAMMLAGGMVFSNDPGDYASDEAEFAALTAGEVRAAASDWLSLPNYRLTVEPFGQYQASADGADRSALPPLGPNPPLTLPERQEATLSNGMRVIFSRKQGTPTVEMVASFDAGGAADQTAKPGLQGFMLGMMDDGTENLTASEFAERSEMLGARINAYGDSDTSNFAASALTLSLDDTVALWSDMIRHPGFREEDLERDRQNALNGVRQSQASPDAIAGRVFQYLLYGPDHAYGAPLAGRAEVIESYSREEVAQFHGRWIRPDNGTIYAAGDVDFDTLIATLERHFGDWQPPETARGDKPVAPLTAQAAPRVVLVDKPGAIQSVIRVGQIMPDGLDPVNFDLDAVNGVLGGGFTARLNMNLREDKGWTYGASSGIGGGRGPQAFTVATSVQTDKTAEALTEIDGELHGITGARPVTPEELELYRRGEVLTLPDRLETNNAMVGYLRYVDRYDHPYEWIVSLADRYAAITPDTIAQTATMLHPDAMTWVIVGDLSKIEAPIRALDLGEVEVWDVEGNRLR